MMLKSRYIILLCFPFLTFCTKDLNAPQTLNSFVQIRFRGGNVEELLKLTGGALKAELEEMTEEQREEFESFSGHEFKDLEIESKNCTDDKCFLTYTLSYYKGDEKDPEFLIRLKKIAEISRKSEQSRWKIVDVNDVKSYYDAKKAIEP